MIVTVTMNPAIDKTVEICVFEYVVILNFSGVRFVIFIYQMLEIFNTAVSRIVA